MISKIKNVIFLLVLGTVCTSLLVGFDSYTREKIEKVREHQLQSTVLDAAEIPFTEETVEEEFSKIRTASTNGLNYYLTPEDHYVFEFVGRGLWGLIEGVIVLNRDLVTVENVRIISQVETPGLGARIAEEEYLAQFKKKKASPELVLVLRIKGTKDNEIDSISGATLTSSAFVKMINESIKEFRKKMGS